jgi:Hg(II)-responsive transcriptional regulator
METLTTSEVAEHAGVNVQTIRYYERRGLLPEPPRRPSGYRNYSEDDVTRVRFIKRAQEIGFTLAEIQDMLSLRADPEAAAEMKQRSQAKMREIDEKIRDLEQVKRQLAELADICSGHGPAHECAIWRALEG